jgi:hypothetical protein
MTALAELSRADRRRIVERLAEAKELDRLSEPQPDAGSYSDEPPFWVRSAYAADMSSWGLAADWLAVAGTTLLTVLTYRRD